MRQEDERLHRRVWELLPWYVNGTLPDGEQRTVEAHAARCAPCREEIESCRKLGEALRQEEETAPSPHPARLARLMARLDEAGEGSLAARLRSLAAATPRPVRWAMAAQLAALLLLAGAWVWQSSSGAAGAPPALYRTLSDPAPPAPAPVPGAVRVRVVFAEDASERQIRDVLLGIGGQLAAGPSPLGAYTVELPAGRDPLPLVLAHLRSRPEVRFAEPVIGDGGR
jgi:putative zinc finger protein